jgi:catechol 2,3-dioxygenase-like lactoylglutathione lyase family enzyme
MGTIGGVHHVAIKARDVERVASFYRDVLGLVEERRHQDDAGLLRSLWLRAGTTIVMIERAGTEAEPHGPANTGFFVDPPGLHLLAFTISAEDREDFAARLPIVHRTDYTLYLLDPEGNRVGLSSYPDRSAENA